jgi:Fic family protein
MWYKLLIMSVLALTAHRTYETTHPWITLAANFTKQLQPKSWMLLGECRSKCEHIAGIPLPPDKAERMYAVYLAKGALATTAIEGNTLSEQEVLDHLEGKLKLPPSREYLAQEIDNIVTACNAIAGEIKEKRTLNLSADRIRELNRLVLNNLTQDEDVTPAGEIRRHEVTVARYRGVPAEDCLYLLEHLCEWLGGPDFVPPVEHMILPIAILKAVIAHVYLAWIHPFGDGNGRTARLVEFQILISSGVPAPAAHLLSNHYNQTRNEYYRQLDNASRSGGDLVPFVDYALSGFVDGLKQQVDHVRQQQWDAAWRDHVQEAFGGIRSSADARRLGLILELSARTESLAITKIPELNASLAVMYAGKTKRTLIRDINALEKKDLLARDQHRVRARKEKILAFLPIKAETIICGDQKKKSQSAG